MSEQSDRARLELAAAGLDYVFDNDEESDGIFVRKDFFIPLKEQLDSVEHKKAFKAKAWQTTYLNNLIALGAVEQSNANSKVSYEIKDKKIISTLLLDWRNGDGELISKVVFRPIKDEANYRQMMARRIVELWGHSGEFTAGLVEELKEKGIDDKAIVLEKAMATDKAAEDARPEIPAGVTELLDILDGVVASQEEVTNALASVLETQAHVTQELAQLKAEQRRSTKASQELGNSFQGLIRSIKEISIEPPKVEWPVELLDLGADVADLKKRTADQLKELYKVLDVLVTRVDAHGKNQLGLAATTLKAATELVADAIAENGK